MNRILSTYGLTRLPFSKDLPAPELFQTDQLQEIMLGLKAAIEGRTSAVLTGDSGSGKTCLIRALAEDLPEGRYRLHYTANSSVNRRDFYSQISAGLGLESHSSFAALYASVSQHIQELAAQHKLRVILVCDEAHMLPVQVLEQLHVLMNFEKDSKPWLSIILVGLPDLRETLKRNVLASLASRIPIRLHVPPLDPDQVKLYVRHRMNTAGCRREVFSDDALLLVAKATGGLMRRIDLLADHCLTIAMKTKATIIDASVVQKGIQVSGDSLQ
jgi:type II secretory pathway predicted ATPase ExeA